MSYTAVGMYLTLLNCALKKAKVVKYYVYFTIIKKNYRDSPGSPVVKNPPANSGDTGSIHSLGRSCISQSNQACVPQLLSPCTLEPRLYSKRSHLNEKPMRCNGEQFPLATTRESLHAATKTWSRQKIK